MFIWANISWARRDPWSPSEISAGQENDLSCYLMLMIFYVVKLYEAGFWKLCSYEQVLRHSRFIEARS